PIVCERLLLPSLGAPVRACGRRMMTLCAGRMIHDRLPGFFSVSLDTGKRGGYKTGNTFL
ncbi:hypothetical protein, partial [Desulfovibrio piger]|uniref:hypothetical protein n=1 Tax=Desulfovibrio piger TaxID=901 RepID=UPI0039F63BDD